MTDTLPKSDRLKGKVAIVTGAGCVGSGWGNGRAVAVIFAMAGRRCSRSIATWAPWRKPSNASVKPAVRSPHSPAMSPTVRRSPRWSPRAKRLTARSIFSSTTSAVPPRAALWHCAEDKFDAQIALNLRSVYLTCKHVLPLMEAQGGGSIINTASTSGTRWTGSAQVAYAASKAGVIQLSRVTAVEYAPKGIRVNTVVPGAVAYADGRSAPGRATHGRRCEQTARFACGTHSTRVHGRWPRYGVCSAVSGQ